VDAELRSFNHAPRPTRSRKRTRADTPARPRQTIRLGSDTGESPPRRYRSGQYGSGISYSSFEGAARIGRRAESPLVCCVAWIRECEQVPSPGGRLERDYVRGCNTHPQFTHRVDENGTHPSRSRVQPYAAQVQAGNALLLAGEWNRAFLDEHETFPAGKFKDQVDAAAGAFSKLRTGSRYDTSMTRVNHTDGKERRMTGGAATCSPQTFLRILDIEIALSRRGRDRSRIIRMRAHSKIPSAPQRPPR
jgi:hypothetical protein